MAGTVPEAPVVTPGQVLRATLIACQALRGLPVDARSWDQLPEGDRGDFEAAAESAISAGMSRVLARAAAYKAERDRLAALMDAARRPLAPEELAAVMWNAICEADPDGHLPAYTGLPAYGDPVGLPDGPGVVTLMITAAHEALKPTVADLDQAAELIRAQDAERRCRAVLEEVDPARLDTLADWFDADDQARGRTGTEVQADLRRWAKAIREALELRS